MDNGVSATASTSNVAQENVATPTTSRKSSSGSSSSVCTSTRSNASTELRNCTVFENIQYLGCSKIDNPSDENEMIKLMKFLDEERTEDAVTVTLAVPHTASGLVSLSDSSGCVLTSFVVNRIRFCVRGRLDSRQKHCFAISFTHHPNRQATTSPAKVNGVAPATANSPAHQCHVFRSAQADTAGRALYCFSQAFSNKGPSQFAGDQTRLEFKYEAYLEIRENEGTSQQSPHYVLCPQQSNTIKLRRDRQKRLIIQLKQVSGPPLTVTKCFGMLLAAGRNLRHSDMQLLDMESMAPGADPSVYVITANWDPRIHMFDVLNTETPDKQGCIVLTFSISTIIIGLFL